MTALKADRGIERAANLSRFPPSARVAAGVVIFKGARICRNRRGLVVPAADELGLRVLGIAAEKVDNRLGGDGERRVKYFSGLAMHDRNDTTSPVTEDHIGLVVYVKDDQTVQASSASGVVAGVLDGIDPEGPRVWTDSLISVSTEPFAAQLETVTAPSELSVFARVSLLAPAVPTALTLPAGRYKGQGKTVRMTGGPGTATVVGAYNTDGTATTTALFNAAGDQLELVWNGTAWQVLTNVSVALS